MSQRRWGSESALCLTGSANARASPEPIPGPSSRYNPTDKLLAYRAPFMIYADCCFADGATLSHHKRTSQHNPGLSITKARQGGDISVFSWEIDHVVREVQRELIERKNPCILICFVKTMFAVTVFAGERGCAVRPDSEFPHLKLLGGDALVVRLDDGDSSRSQ